MLKNNHPSCVFKREKIMKFVDSAKEIEQTFLFIKKIRLLQNIFFYLI